MKIDKYEKGKKLPRIIRIPNLFLRLKGRFDAKRGGESVVNAYVRKITHRAAKLESKEVITVSKFLSSSRERGAILINKIYNARKNMAQRDDSPSNSKSPIDIRRKRLNDSIKASSRQEYNTSVEELIKIGERITYFHSIFQERDISIKERGKEKAQAYFSGVTTVISEYNTSISFDNCAYALYREAHKSTDDHIFNTIEEIRQESEVSNHEKEKGKE